MDNQDKPDVKDETSGFVVTTSDAPEVTPEPQDEPKDEGSTPSENDETEGKEAADSDAKGDETVDEGKKSDTGSNEAAEAKGDKKPNSFQKRINGLTREREEARRETEAGKREIAQLKEAAKTKSEKAEPKEPSEADFDTYDEYLDAVDKHESIQDKPKAKAQAQGEVPKEGVLTDSQKTAMALIEEAVKGADKPDDFDKVALADDVSITGEMLEALAECDDPAKVMYHLGQNKDLATDIAGKSPAQQMRAIAKIDMTAEKPKPPKPVNKSDAPEPIDPVKGSDAQEKKLTEMSFSEFEAKRNKEERAAVGSGW